MIGTAVMCATPFPNSSAFGRDETWNVLLGKHSHSTLSTGRPFVGLSSRATESGHHGCLGRFELR